MSTILAGDIGGTKTILQLAAPGSVATEAPKSLYERIYRSADYTDLVPMVREFLAEAAGESTGLQAACFAIAGPVVANRSHLTNLAWDLQGDRLERELNIPQVALLNDFAAVGYGVTVLGASDLHVLQQDAPPIPQAPIGVLGAGTGLGEAYLTWQGDRYRVHASEGGHTEFAPRSERQIELLRYLWRTHPRVSVERVVSGRGIVAIYQFLRDSNFATQPPEVATAVEQWEQTQTGDAASAISQAAFGGDRLCRETLDIFVEAYGAEAGDLALKLLPYGGLYVAGGIAPKILPAIVQNRFMQAFSDKGRLSPLLSNIPVRIVLNPKVGLLGAALYAAQVDT
jgi:glucokinase